MDTRATIEGILDKTYAARQRQDLDAVLACFHDAGQFRMNGGAVATTSRAEQHAALGGLFGALTMTDFHQYCRVIDPPRAVVHWRGKFRSNKTGEAADADILDIIEIKDGCITSLTTFFDTALAARLTA
jgi:ketosteroid isomerase-like protein